MNLKRLILMLDLFGNKPSFNINGHKSYKTVFGVIMSILLVIMSIIFSIIFNKELFLHKKPEIIETYKYNNFSIKLTNNNIFAFSLKNINSTNYIDESIYNININKIIITKNKNTNYNNYNYNNNDNNNNTFIIEKEKINYYICNNYSFNILQNYFNNLPLNNLYCLNLSDIEIQGEYMRDKYIYIDIEFNKCINNSNNNNNIICKSQEIIDEILNEGYIEIFMSNFGFLANNYKNPIYKYGKNIYRYFNIDKYIEFNIYMKETEIKSDIGIIFETYDNKKFVTLNIIIKN